MKYLSWVVSLASSLSLFGCGSDTTVTTGGAGASTSAASSSVAASTSATGSTGSTGSTASTGAGGASSSSSASTATGAGGALACAPACQFGFACCEGGCANLANDIHNCGACGVVCGGASPFCDGTQCVQAPCTTTKDCSDTCCGNSCCSAGQLCCDVQGPGPSVGPACTDPVNGTCPLGCPTCD